jgi:hypothetical protein
VLQRARCTPRESTLASFEQAVVAATAQERALQVRAGSMEVELQHQSDAVPAPPRSPTARYDHIQMSTTWTGSMSLLPEPTSVLSAFLDLQSALALGSIIQHAFRHEATACLVALARTHAVRAGAHRSDHHQPMTLHAPATSRTPPARCRSRASYLRERRQTPPSPSQPSTTHSCAARS